MSPSHHLRQVTSDIQWVLPSVGIWEHQCGVQYLSVSEVCMYLNSIGVGSRPGGHGQKNSCVYEDFLSICSSDVMWVHVVNYYLIIALL